MGTFASNPCQRQRRALLLGAAGLGVAAVAAAGPAAASVVTGPAIPGFIADRIFEGPIVRGSEFVHNERHERRQSSSVVLRFPLQGPPTAEFTHVNHHRFDGDNMGGAIAIVLPDSTIWVARRDAWVPATGVHSRVTRRGSVSFAIPDEVLNGGIQRVGLTLWRRNTAQGFERFVQEVGKHLPTAIKIIKLV